MLWKTIAFSCKRIITVLYLPDFFTPALADGFPPELEMVSTFFLLSKSSSPCINTFVIVPDHWLRLVSPTSSCSIVYSSPSKLSHLSFFACFFQFLSVVNQDSKVLYSANSLFLVDYYKVWLSGWNFHDPFLSQNPREVCTSYSPEKKSGLCIYHLFVLSNINILNSSLLISLPI